MSMDTMNDTLVDKTFRDNQGNIVIAQKPNLPILVALGSTLLATLPTHPTLSSAFHAIAFGASFTWAWLEIFQGVNYFRRSLGLLALLGVLALHIHW